MPWGKLSFSQSIIICSAYIPDIAVTPENYLGNFTSDQYTEDGDEYRLYGETGLQDQGRGWFSYNTLLQVLIQNFFMHLNFWYI